MSLIDPPDDTSEFPPMDPTVKAKWLTALRSGDYVQGRGYLKPKDTTFCCLGVLSDIYATETGAGTWNGSGRFTAIEGDTRYTDIYELVEPVKRWSGTDSPAINRLASMNDDGTSFDQIADYIEAKL